MVSTIFQPEVTTLESQVAALQAQIAAHTERISLLNETELLAGDSLEALKGAIEKVSSLAPDAIASLKSAVLSLFTGNDSDDGNGNQPINPAPQSGNDGGVSSAIAVIEEPLNGQLCELSSPWYHPPANAAHVESDTACTVSDAPQPEPEQLPYVELIPVSYCVAYQRRSTDGEIICAYLAGNNKNRLKDWGSWLCNQHSVGSGFELREAKRMTAYKWELKIWGMELLQVVRLSETDTTKSVPSRYHVASFPVAAHLLQTDEDAPQAETEQVVVAMNRDVEEIPAAVAKLEPASQPTTLSGFQVGSRVEVISDRHGVELLGQTGIVTAGTAAGAAVDVGGTLRWFCVDELAVECGGKEDSFPPTLAVSTPVSTASLEPTEEEKVAIASIQPPLPVPAYNTNPIGRGGAASNWRARQASGLGVDLKNCGTGGIKTMAEWQQIEAEQKAQKALAAFTSDDEPDF